MLQNFALTTVLLAAASAACFGAAPTAALRLDSTAFCPRATAAPVIDGRLDDACWQSGPQIERFVSVDSAEDAREQTSVYLRFDSKTLYIAFRCVEPEVSKLKTSDSENIWLNDSVEVLIDPDRSRSVYYHLILDAAGRKFQERGEDSTAGLDRQWADPWDGAVYIGEGQWTAEIAIPAGSIGLKAKDGASIRANFGRSEWGLPEVTSWSVTPGGFHQPLCFSNIILGETKGALSADLSLPAGVTAGKSRATVKLANSGRPVQSSVETRIYPVKSRGRSVSIPVDRKAEVTVPVEFPQARRYSLDVLVNGKPASSYSLLVPPSPLKTPGGVLASPEWGAVWEASATFKVMPDQQAPAGKRKSVKVSAAKNEHEPFQIVLHPRAGLKGLNARVSDLKGPGTLPSASVKVNLVETVPVTIPTSPDCEIGDYPDPLPPFRPTDIPSGRNTSLWFTVYVPADAKAGDYKGVVTLTAEGIEPVRIPIELHVWDFALPELSRLRTAYGHDPAGLCAWHGAKDPADRSKVAELLNENFIAHRMSPYSPMAMWDVKMEVVDGKLKIDWTEFDKAASKFLPRMNSFNYSFSWMSDFLGARQGTPEYRELKGQYLKALAAHLREKGWADKGYCYIWDEPEPNMYAHISDEAKMWHDAGLTVLLTEQPEKELDEAVDIWVPILPNYAEGPAKERQAGGDEVWWYVCCGPHHPFPNNFIDYPAVDHRILHWMNWKYGVTGVLYWSTMYWNDNPWTTPMSYTPDRTGKWGNGDGHLLYPAVKEVSKTPVVAGPVDSIRWEMIREGIEDYDYLWMLNDAIRKAEGDPKKADAVSAGKEALAEVDLLVRSVTDYETDPTKLYAARKKVAEAIENLTR